MLGQNPENGRDVVLKDGRFGPYLEEVLPAEPEAAPEAPKKRGVKKPEPVKPRRASLFKSMSPETVDLDTALRLLSLPRTVGLDPETEEQRYLVDGKLGPRPKAEVLDAAGTLLYSVKGQILGIPKKMAISDAAGTEVALLKAKAFSLVKDKMDMQMASVEKNYTVTSGGREVVRISQKWLTMRDKYALEIADGIDVGLALAVVWAIDRWVERD